MSVSLKTISLFFGLGLLINTAKAQIMKDYHGELQDKKQRKQQERINQRKANQDAYFQERKNQREAILKKRRMLLKEKEDEIRFRKEFAAQEEKERQLNEELAKQRRGSYPERQPASQGGYDYGAGDSQYRGQSRNPNNYQSPRDVAERRRQMREEKAYRQRVHNRNMERRNNYKQRMKKYNRMEDMYDR